MAVIERRHTHTHIYIYIYIYMVKDLDFSNFALKLLPCYHLGVISILRTPQFDIQGYHMFVQPSSKTVQLKGLTRNWDQVEEVSEGGRAKRTCSSWPRTTQGSQLTPGRQIIQANLLFCTISWWLDARCLRYSRLVLALKEHKEAESECCTEAIESKKRKNC